MIADKLRKSILQAAIQGKLTKQLPEDGDARTLLADIKAEKAQSIKEGKLKQEKPITEITEDEIPFDIPENWCWCRIGHIFSLQAGKFISSGNIKSEGKYPCYGGNGLRGYVETCNRSGRFPLIGRQGALCGNINIADGEFYATEHAVVVQWYCNCIADWAAYFLGALNLNQYSTATAQPGLAVNKINQIVFPLPPLAEQQRIVIAIEEAFEKIKELEEDEVKLNLLQKSFPKKMKDSLLQAAIQGKLTEQLASDGDARKLVADIQKEKECLVKEGKIKKEKVLPKITEDDIPFEIPENWCWVRLGDVGETNIGLTYKPTDVSINGTLVLRSGNIKNNKIDYSDNLYVNCDVAESKKCHVGDILVCARNGSKKLVGKAAIVDQDGMTFGAFMALYRSPFNKYIHKYLSSPYFRSDLDGVSTTTINQITQNNLKERLVPLPPLAEQLRIVEKLEQLLPLCDALE